MHLIACILQRTSYILHIASCILHLASCVLHLASYILHHASYTSHLPSYFLHLTPSILHLRMLGIEPRPQETGVLWLRYLTCARGHQQSLSLSLLVYLYVVLSFGLFFSRTLPIGRSEFRKRVFTNSPIVRLRNVRFSRRNSNARCLNGCGI